MALDQGNRPFRIMPPKQLFGEEEEQPVEDLRNSEGVPRTNQRSLRGGADRIPPVPLCEGTKEFKYAPLV